MLALWWSRGRDPDTRAIDVRYEPPEGLTPGEAGALVDAKVRLRHITATLVERMLGAPDGREAVRMSDLGLPFRAVRAVAGFFDRIVERGYFPRRPAWTRLRYFGAAGLVLLVGRSPVVPLEPAGLASVVVTALIVGGVGWHMPVRTPAGTRAAEAALGFREYLVRTEVDRLERTIERPSEIEPALAHAIALGVERRWTEAFDDLYGPAVQSVDEEEVEEYRRVARDACRAFLDRRS